MPAAAPADPSPGARLPRRAAHVAVMALMAFAFAAGARGIDFGWHWDEDRLLLSVGESIESATLLPGRYNYPSVSYGLALAGALPEATSAFVTARQVLASSADRDSRKARLAQVAAELAPVVDRPGFKFRVRTIFLLVSLLSILWVYLAVLAWRNDVREALLAAALLGVSWEVGYHARWMAPDAVLMQFAALGLVALFTARRAGASAWRWIVGGAVIAGLAMGTKYQGAVLLAPVLALALERALAGGRRLVSALWTRLLPLVLLAGLVYLLTTPGTVLQPMRFAYDVLFELRHYHTGHGSETVAPGAEHLGRVLEYLAFVAFSRWWPLALLVFGAAVAGAVEVLRRDRGAAALLLLVPLLAVLAMSTMRVMIVRNLLFLLPFLAILAARGVSAAAGALHTRTLAVVPWIACAALVIANAAWLWMAAGSIADRTSIDHGARIARWVDAHPRDTFAFSRSAWDALPPEQRARANVTLDAARATRFILMTTDVRAPWGNRFGVYEQVSGPHEVNFDWYPDWQGEPHALVVRARSAAYIRFVPATP